HNKPTCELTFMLICTNRVPIAKPCRSILVVNAHRTYEKCGLLVPDGICHNEDKGTWAVTDLIVTPQMYLRTNQELMDEGIAPVQARIAERLEHSGPTVSQTVARMERDGLLHVASDRRLELTEQGLTSAATVMRKHRLAERLLADVIGLDWPYVHEEACRWE